VPSLKDVARIAFSAASGPSVSCRVRLAGRDRSRVRRARRSVAWRLHRLL